MIIEFNYLYNVRLLYKNDIIVLAGGVFDILHVGHIRYLKEAKNLGDILVVGVNSDKSTKLIKGTNRPIIPEYERIEILDAIKFIDFIYLFDELTISKTMELLLPNIFVKGKDYSLNEISEKDILEKYNINFYTTGDQKIHSSTELIERILSSAA